jgi:hypothetical protein
MKAISGNREAIITCSPSVGSPQPNGSPLKRKTFRIAVKAASGAIAGGAISQAIGYIELALSVSVSSENVLELLEIVNNATANMKERDSAHTAGESSALDFTLWDAGDDELLELKHILLSYVDSKAEEA